MGEVSRVLPACLPPSLAQLVCQPVLRVRRAVPRHALLCHAKAALIWRQPPVPVLGLGLGRDRNRKVQRAGSWEGQGNEEGSEMGQGGKMSQAAWQGQGGISDPPMSSS